MKLEFPSCVTRNFIFIKNSELRKINEKLAVTSQFDLTRFYDVIMRSPLGMILIKSCNQIFMAGYLFLQIVSNK